MSITPDNAKDSIKLLLDYKGRVDDPITWDLEDWKLYWLIYFFKETDFIEFIPRENIYDFVIKNFRTVQNEQYKKSSLSAHVSRTKVKIDAEKQCVYYNYYQKLQDIFTTFHHI